MKKAVSLAVALGLLAAVPAAATISIDNNRATLTSDSIGSTVDVGYNGQRDQGGSVFIQDGLAANISFTLHSIGNAGRTWNFITGITNLSEAPMTSARLSLFGMGVEGHDANGQAVAISGAAASAAPDGPATPVYGSVLRARDLGGDNNVPMLGGIADICFAAGSGTTSSCSGGGGGGLTMGSNPFPTTSQVMSLTFEKSLVSLDLFDFFVRWQSLAGTRNGSSFNNQSGVGLGTIDISGIDPGGNAIPEPASWLMLIAGFGLIGATMRHRRAVAA